MELNVWLAFVVAAAVIAISPGSGAVLCMSHGLSYGLRRSFATIMGLQVGLLLVTLVSAFGLGALLLASETLFTAVKWIGAAYLFYLGASLIWQSRTPKAEQQEPTQETMQQTLQKTSTEAQSKVTEIAGADIAGEMSATKRFILGFFTNATNPKGIVFMVAVLPQFMNPNTPNLFLEVFILWFTLFVIDTAVMHGYAGMASTLAHVFKNPAAVRWQNRIFGGVLMAAGAGVLAVRRVA